MKIYYRTPSVITFVQLFIVLAGLALSSGAAADDRAPALIEWQLTDTKVISWGKVGNGAEGSMRTGVKVEAKAVTTTPGAIFSEGAFSATLNIFNPTGDVSDKKAGNWYLRGEWAVTAKDADPAVLKSRYNPYALSGMLTASIPYDPSIAVGVMEAEMRLQRGGSKPRTGRMQAGTFSGSSNFEGKLTTPFIASTTK